MTFGHSVPSNFLGERPFRMRYPLDRGVIDSEAVVARQLRGENFECQLLACSELLDALQSTREHPVQHSNGAHVRWELERLNGAH